MVVMDVMMLVWVYKILVIFVIVTVKNTDSRVYIAGVDKRASVYLLKKSVLSDKGVL